MTLLRELVIGSIVGSAAFAIVWSVRSEKPVVTAGHSRLTRPAGVSTVAPAALCPPPAKGVPLKLGAALSYEDTVLAEPTGSENVRLLRMVRTTVEGEVFKLLLGVQGPCDAILKPDSSRKMQIRAKVDVREGRAAVVNLAPDLSSIEDPRASGEFVQCLLERAASSRALGAPIELKFTPKWFVFQGDVPLSMELR